MWWICLLPYPDVSMQLHDWWCSLIDWCVGLGHQSEYIWGVVWSGGFSRSVYLLARPSKHVADILRRHPGPQDVPVCDLHQSDGNLTLELSVQSRVDLLPLFVRQMEILFRVSAASAPISPSKEVTNSEKCWGCWRHTSRYIFFFARSASCRHFSGVFTEWYLES